MFRFVFSHLQAVENCKRENIQLRVYNVIKTEILLQVQLLDS